MAGEQITYEQFLDLVKKTKIGEARIIIEDREAPADEEERARFHSLALTPELVITFAENVANYFEQRLSGICTDALYKRMAKDAHAFLVEVFEKAKRLGVQVDIKKVNLPVTITEALIASGCAKIAKN